VKPGENEDSFGGILEGTSEDHNGTHYRPTKVCDCLSYRIVKANVDIRLTDKDEECVPELPADVDPVMMVGDDREGLSTIPYRGSFIGSQNGRTSTQDTKQSGQPKEKLDENVRIRSKSYSGTYYNCCSLR